MEIEQFRITLKTRDYERTCIFYGETLALPELESWEREDILGSRFQAGAGVIEVLGRRPGAPKRDDDALFEYRGPHHEMEIVLAVPSPRKAYDELIFRQKNIPGGMLTDEDGEEYFRTYDPDGVHVLLKKA